MINTSRAILSSIKVKKGHRSGLFTQRWAWTMKDIERILTILKDCPKPVVHVCSGASCIGEYRIDMAVVDSEKIQDKPYRGTANILGDMCCLPLKSGSAGTIITDPPYNYEFRDNEEDPYIFELVRVLKPAGRLIFYAPWVYTHPALKCLKITPVRVGVKRYYFKLMSEHIKINGQISDYLNGGAEPIASV